MGFRLNLRWAGLSIQSPFSTSSSSWPSSYSCKARDSSCFLARSSILYGETELLSDTLRASLSSASPQIAENYYLGNGEIKMALGKGSADGICSLMDAEIQTSEKEDKLAYLTSLQATQASQFRLLMRNLDMLEGLFLDTDMIRLEKDILEQLERLGALCLFRSCLSRTLESSSCTLSDAPTSGKELVQNDFVKNNASKVIIHSGKKELRKLRRKIPLENEICGSFPKLPSETNSSNPLQSKCASGRRPSKSRNKRSKIARNEAEMSSGVKLVAELEKIRRILEEETGQVASFSRWAEAAGVDKRKLQQQLYYGWHCRDELLRSTRSLVLYIARNYWGLGVGLEDLIQAGKLGVLQGAERFDKSRGYKFSTYVQYWIRKSMSNLVAGHGRGIRIPSTLTRVINQVQKARKALTRSHGRCPDDYEIAKFTGLSIAKITSASKCLRIVGSVDQKIGDCVSAKFLEIAPDTSITSPEETVNRQHMINDIYMLLDGLEPREKLVLILRFGIGNRQCKSLEEIGKLLFVSKEWIRRIEKGALTKLRSEETLQILSQYVYMQ